MGDVLIETYRGGTAKLGITDLPYGLNLYNGWHSINRANAETLARSHPETWQIKKETSMTLGNWLKGLGVMVAAAAASAAAQVVSNRSTNKNAPAITGANVGLTAGVAAIGAFLAYLAQSPLPTTPPPTDPAK